MRQRNKKKTVIQRRTTTPADRERSAQLVNIIGVLTVLLLEVPAEELVPGERDVRAGDLIPLGPSLNACVGQGLIDRPELFSDILFSGGEILERQERASLWRILQGLLQGAADTCRDNYVLEQSTANRLSLHVIDSVEAVAERPHLSPHLDARARGRCLLAALRLMEGVREGKRPGRGRGKGKRGDQPPATPQQKKARQAATARRRAALQATFEDAQKKGR